MSFPPRWFWVYVLLSYPLNIFCVFNLGFDNHLDAEGLGLAVLFSPIMFVYTGLMTFCKYAVLPLATLIGGALK